MAVKTIDSPEALYAKLQEMDAERGRLANSLQSISDIQKSGLILGNNKENDLSGLGAFVKAVASKDRDKIATAGGLEVSSGGKKTALGSEYLVGDAETGSFLVPQMLYDKYIYTPFGVSEIVPLLRHVSMANRLIRYPIELTSSSFTAVSSEMTDKIESAPTFSYCDLETETFAYWVAFSDEFMEDTNQDIGNIIRTQALEELAINVLEQQALASNGAPFTGVLHESGTETVTTDSTSFADVTVDDLRLMPAEFDDAKQLRGAVYMMHPSIWNILQAEMDGIGAYRFSAMLGLDRKMWGYPVALSDVMPKASETATNTKFVVFGNPKYILNGTRVGLEIKFFDKTMYAVQNDEVFFRIRTRQGMKVAIPGNFCCLRTATN